MNRRLRGILVLAVGLALLAGAATVADASAAPATSKPVLSAIPRKDRPFRVSGFVTPKSTAASRVKVKIILWMANGDGGYGVMDTYWAKVGVRAGGKPGSAYSLTLTIPMKGDHGVQAVQYRSGKKVSSSRTTYFTVQP